MRTIPKRPKFSYNVKAFVASSNDDSIHIDLHIKTVEETGLEFSIPHLERTGTDLVK
jgi:hypothetical protein